MNKILASQPRKWKMVSLNDKTRKKHFHFENFGDRNNSLWWTLKPANQNKERNDLNEFK
jgi:hypothetical protein